MTAHCTEKRADCEWRMKYRMNVESRADSTKASFGLKSFFRHSSFRPGLVIRFIKAAADLFDFVDFEEIAFLDVIEAR